MNSAAERKQFSERLHQALLAADYATDAPTQLAREFNARYSGGPITPHAARKWIIGEAIPGQSKLVVLANWLGVTATWLRFGGPLNEVSGSVTTAAADRFETEDIKMLADLRQLGPTDKIIIRELVRSMIRNAVPAAV